MEYWVAVAAKEARAFWILAFSERAAGLAAAVKEASSAVT
jgi:hypothetical protein